ncbi:MULTISPECIES: hypothetical protein [environmental samples]|uniref:hypothetical protein n=2 Tax=Oscillibacter TaxID=459786 RepID=UPI0003378561|nr:MULTISPECIES: hypothetical protein [environmental samples]CDC71725.1 site-specific recombinase phage integrase family [Oscillibacter sp. CAG:155]
MDVKTLSAMVGNRFSSTTLNVYPHVTKAMERQAGVKIDQGIGKQSSQNVYGRALEECEEKLKVLIETMKAEFRRSGVSSGKQGTGHESEKKLPQMREFSCLGYFCGQQKTEKNQNTAKVRKSCER